MIVFWAVVVTAIVIGLGFVIWHIADEISQGRAERRRQANVQRLHRNAKTCERVR